MRVTTGIKRRAATHSMYGLCGFTSSVCKKKKGADMCSRHDIGLGGSHSSHLHHRNLTRCGDCLRVCIRLGDGFFFGWCRWVIQGGVLFFFVSFKHVVCLSFVSSGQVVSPASINGKYKRVIGVNRRVSFCFVCFLGKRTYMMCDEWVRLNRGRFVYVLEGYTILARTVYLWIILM